MQEDRISRFYDLNNIKVESEYVLEYLTKVLQLIREINVAKDQMDKAGTFKIIADSVSKVKQAVDETTAATTKLTEATTKAAQKQVDAYTQLKNQYSDAIRNAQNLAAQFGAQSEQATKAAQAADIYRQRLQQIQDLVKSGGKQVDSGIVPYSNNLDSWERERESMKNVGTVVNEVDKAEAALANTATAMGQAQLEAAQAGNAAAESMKASGVIIEDVALKYDQYTGTLKENIQLQILNAKALEENRAAQKTLQAEEELNIEQLAALKQEELQLVQANKELNQSIQNQVKEFQAADGSIDQMQAQLALLKQSYETLSAEAKASPFGTSLKKEIDQLDPAVKKAEQAIGNAQRSVGGYFQAIQAAGSKLVTFVTRDLFRAFAGFLVFQLAFEAGKKVFDAMVEVYQRATKGLEEFGQRLDFINESIKAAGNEYVKAANNVEELKQNVERAKEGFIDKKKVVDEYNESMGKTTGQVKSLAEVEQKLIDVGPAYLKMMLYKAAANHALEEAAKKAFEAEQRNLAPIPTSGNAFTGGNDLVHGSDRGRLEEEAKKTQEFIALKKKGDEAFLNGNPDYKKYFQEQDDFIADYINKHANKDLLTQQDAFTKIADDFSKKAAEISKKFHFNFFEDTGNGGNAPTKDYLEELYKQQEALRKAQYDSQQLRLKGQIDFDKSVVEDDEKTFDERLKASQKFYDDSLALLVKQRDYELKDVDSKNGDASRKVKLELQNNKLIASQRETLQKTLTKIVQAGVEERKKVLEKFNLDVFHLNQTSGDQISKIMDDDQKQRQQHVKEQIDSILKVLQQQTDAIDDAAQDELRKNDELYAKGLIGKESYEKKKLAIENEARKESLQADITYYEEILALVDLDGTTREKYEKDIAKLKKQYNDEDAKDKGKTAEQDRKDLDLKKQKIQELGDALKNTAFSFLGSAIEQQKNAVQDQINAIDKLTQKEIDAVNQSVASQQDKAARIAIIEAQAQNQKEILAQRQKQLDEQKAKFDRLSSIVGVIESTAKAVTSDLKDHKELVPYDYAIGAAQLAAILAQPIPHYARGTKDHPGGLAVVGDGGRSELVVTPGGDLFRTPSSSTLVDLPEHSLVLPQLPSAETIAMWATKGAMGAISGRRPGVDPLAASISKMERNVVSAVKSIPQPFIKVEGQITRWVRSKNSWFNDLKN